MSRAPQPSCWYRRCASARWDALVVDVRSLRPAPDLQADFVYEMRGAFMVRRGHPLARRRDRPGFDDLLRYPIASTPLSDARACWSSATVRTLIRTRA